jgi:hypothetical protein
VGCCNCKFSSCCFWLHIVICPQGAKEEGVDLEHPPNTKLFDATYHDTNDLGLLSRRRAANQPLTAAPSIVINNDFEGLAAMFQGNKPPPGPQVPANPVPRPIRAAQVPKMTLIAFCERFDISDFVLQKLDVLKITGPHGLRFVTDEQLVHAGQLDIGELADVRDAQERWTLGQGQAR